MRLTFRSWLGAGWCRCTARLLLLLNELLDEMLDMEADEIEPSWRAVGFLLLGRGGGFEGSTRCCGLLCWCWSGRGGRGRACN